MRSRLAYVVFGLLATVVGMTAGYLVAELLHPDSSPIFAVGETIIDHTPTGAKEWAIRHFGTNDKKVLISSVLAVVLVAVAVVMFVVGGLKHRARIGTAVLVAIVAVAVAAALTRPQVSALDVIPSIATALAGVGAFVVLDRTFTGQALLPGRGTSVPAEGEGDADDVERPSPSRRAVLVASAAMAALAVAFEAVGKVVEHFRTAPEDITLPKPGSPAPPIPAGLDKTVPGITPLRTSNGDFYRVDTRLDTPVVDSGSWSLTIDGDVDHELHISFDDLLAMPMIERDITLTCVSNSVGGPYVGSATWQGVPLQHLLDMAGVGSKADQILSTDFDGMTISTPLDLATDGRDAMLAVGMNGVELPREHGFPVRMIVPGLYGFISGTKWVTKLTLTTYADQQAYWTKKKWATDAPIKPSTRIDTPKALSTVKKGEAVMGGVAWAQNDGGVSKVQVSIDGGPWVDATEGPDVGNVYWRQWFHKWDASSGQHTLAARCVDGKGQVQTAARAEPFPGGSSGIHTVIVTAS